LIKALITITFHRFEILDQDPFWVPATEEELEDIGEIADKENVAKRYMDGVRKRKVSSNCLVVDKQHLTAKYSGFIC
jgi:hypothetical protein